MSLDDKLDSRVTLHGVACNAMAGSVVLVDDRAPVYIDGVDRWDQAVDGKSVRATGTLRRTAGDDVIDDNDEHRHGIPGERFVLEQATWTVD